MHGGNLRDIVNLHLFKNFRKPEFHLYDSDGSGTYVEQQVEVNARNDGSVALQTKKRCMECYVHPAAIRRVKNVIVSVTDTGDYTNEFCGLISVKRAEAKAILADEIAPQMTVMEIDERDGCGEIRGWLLALAEMAART